MTAPGKGSEHAVWLALFRELVVCPDCQAMALAEVDGRIECGQCGGVFTFANGIPHLYASAFRRVIQKVLDRPGADLSPEEAVIKANIEFHNSHANGYDRDPAIHHLLSASGRSLIREFIHHCRERTQGRVWLDVGCGTGQLMSIGEKFPVTVGVDISESMALIATGKGHHVFLGDAGNLPCATESVDLVTACAVLHHLPDPSLFIKQAFRVLRPGGMIFTDFDPNNRPAHNGLIFRSLRWLYRAVKPRRKSIHTESREVERQSQMADYQMYFNSSFNGETMASAMAGAGFVEVRVDYYFEKAGMDEPDRPPLSYLLRRILMAPVAKLLDKKEIAPNFLILARKPAIVDLP